MHLFCLYVLEGLVGFFKSSTIDGSGFVRTLSSRSNVGNERVKGSYHEFDYRLLCFSKSKCVYVVV